MIPPIKQDILATLASVCELSPDLRLGRLFVELGLLAEDMSGHSLADMDDRELLQLIERHHADLSQRGPDVNYHASDGGPVSSAVRGPERQWEVGPPVNEGGPFRLPSTTGKCATCGYGPVAFDAQTCPKCGARNPNPSATNRYVALSVPIGLLVFGLAGAVWGYFTFDAGAGGAIGGFLIGALPGVVLGLVASMVASLLVRLFGIR
jgi:hypothetical protein